MTSQTVQLRSRSGLWLALLWVTIAALPALGQNGGDLSGVVTNQAGATLPEVAVTIKNLDTGETRTIPTDGAGRYQASGLPPGRFEIRATKSGFADERRT